MVKHDEIKESVNKFNKDNGNINIPIKDMVIHLLGKFDDLPCHDIIKTTAETKGRVDILVWAIGIGFTIFGSVMLYHMFG